MKHYKASEILKKFINKIGAIKHPEYSRAQIYRLVPNKEALRIKVSTEERYFWGLRKKYIDELNEDENNCFTVLLDSDFSGWIYSENEVFQKIDQKVWRLASDQEYKVNESDIDSNNRFSSINEFFSKLR